MGRRFTIAVVGTAAVSVLAQTAFAQNPVPPPHPRAVMRDQWRAMSPEDRQRFRSNAERWLSMPPEQRRAFRMQETMRREHLRREAEAAMRESGLQLEAERRAQFEQRYFEERRRIDRELRQEIQQRRERELAPVVEQLKKEFGQPQGSAIPAAVHTASPGATK